MFRTTTIKLTIRHITPDDNQKLADLIKRVSLEHGFGEGSGSAAEDPEINDLAGYFKEYNGDYFVIRDEKGEICGGGGFARLKTSKPEDKICEVQKFYFNPEFRNAKIGKELLYRVLMGALNAGYKKAYSDSSSKLPKAIALAKFYGFNDCPALSNIGHEDEWDVHMSVELNGDNIKAAYARASKPQLAPIDDLTQTLKSKL